MAERQAFIDRVKGAERECYVVIAAVNHYWLAIQQDFARLPEKQRPEIWLRPLKRSTQPI